MITLIRQEPAISDAQLRQLITTDPLTHMECRDGLLRRGNEIFLVAFASSDLVQLLIKVRKLCGLRHHIAVHEEWGLERQLQHRHTHNLTCSVV